MNKECDIYILMTLGNGMVKPCNSRFNVSCGKMVDSQADVPDDESKDGIN